MFVLTCNGCIMESL